MENEAGSPFVGSEDYLEIFSRRRRLILGGVVVGAAAASIWAGVQQPIYTPTATVIVTPTGAGPLDPAVRTDHVVNIATERTLARSEVIAKQAIERLQDAAEPGKLNEGLIPGVEEIIENLDVAAVPETEILEFRYPNHNERVAITTANAAASTYLDYRRSLAIEAIDLSRSQLESQAELVVSDLREANQILATAAADSENFRAARVDVDLLTDELSGIRTQLTALGQMAPTPGTVIQDAGTLASGSKPSIPGFALLGALVGGLIGVGVAFLRHRTDDRLATDDDVLSNAGVRVLGTVPEAPTVIGDLALMDERTSESYRRLTSSVTYLAQRRDAEILLISSPNLETEVTSLTAQLGASAARLGQRVLLLSANLRAPRLHHAFGLAGTAGLFEMLVLERPPVETIQQLARYPRLHVLSGGQPVEDPGEILQSPRFREFLDLARVEYDLILVEAPAANQYADALTVAPMTDAAVLVVASGRSTRTELQQTTNLLASIDVEILGSIVLSNSGTSRRRRGEPEAAHRAQVS